MNKDPSSEELLQEIYAYYCQSLQKNFVLVPAKLSHIELCFKKLLMNIQALQKLSIDVDK